MYIVKIYNSSNDVVVSDVFNFLDNAKKYIDTLSSDKHGLRYTIEYTKQNINNLYTVKEGCVMFEDIVK